MSGPELLILDEPTNGLDPRQIIELRELIRSLASSCAILVTSHVLAEIERVARRVAILLNGRLLTVHTLAEGVAGRQLRVRVRTDDPQAAGACFAAVPGVGAVQFEGRQGGVGTWRVPVADAQAGERVVAAMTSAGFGVQEVTAAAPDLESLFLRLTGEARPR
jgi:ABC-2 type transport system ATP-binding protein